MPFVSLSRGRMAYDEVGRGRAVVCLHSGWGQKAMSFDDAREMLASRYRFVSPDRFGYGRSDPLHRLELDYHARAAADLFELLERLARRFSGDTATVP